MSNPSTGAQTRLNFRSSPHSTAAATRNSIINSSAHGWSPLKIAKRDDSPLKSPGMSDQGESPGLDASPRRTSSSFKHVTKNSLVSNSIFKQSAAPSGLNPAEERVIHERAGRRGMGEAPASASGVASTPKASIGLGISANAKPRSASRSASGGRSSIGVRRVSTDRTKASPSASGERRVSGERVVSGSKENESPDIRSGKRVPRQSMGLKGLARNEYVSKSPFRRVPSGGLSSASSTRANESPTHPSPRSIPVEKDDLFSSPSPSASKRRASPSKFRTRNTSPTPSPPRGIAQSTLASAVVPSPLGQGQTLAAGSYSDMSPSPTPIKSSMTPSKRLKGPRDYSDVSYDSPTKSKTVTFQAVPDVKEFEAAAGETATPDVSFEQETQSEGEDDGEWADEDLRDDSLEDILHEPETLEKAFGRQQYRVTNPDAPNQEASEDGHNGVGDESATAEFMDTLISEGLFSPPELSTPAFEDYSQFHLSDGPAPFLSTPSMGDSVHATPMLAGVEPETDGAGIPYGRTHHAERNAAAHSQVAPVRLGAPIEQPAFPHGGDHQMLHNADASQPALAPALAQSSTNHLAHQSGTIPDPFLTIQTATNVLTSTTERKEDGIPLGRTSHIERMQAARMLATQSLGIGMPRSPGLSQTFAVQQAAARPAQPSSSGSADGESVDSEMLFDASFELGMSEDEQDSPAPTRLAPLQQTVEKEEKMEAVANGRRLPKPPRVEEVKLPSPVNGRSTSSGGSSPEEQAKANGFDFSKGFSLPSIGLMSPFETAAPTMPSAAPVEEVVEEEKEEEEVLEIDDSRPLTPPPMIAREKREDSPHRIPSFEFKFGALDLGGDVKEMGKEAEVKAAAAAPAKVSPPAVTVTRPRSSFIETRPRPVSSSVPEPKVTRPMSGELGPASPPQASGSTTTRVRQRISREMIRETIQQRLADGTLSRHTSSASGHILDAEIPKRRPHSLAIGTGIGKDKDLPAPPPKTPDLLGSDSVPMAKAHTTDAPTNRRASHQDRPAMRPRSKTQSAEEVIQSNVKDDGFIKEPKSALDRLMDGMNSVALSTSPDRVKAVFAKPISILQKPKDSTLIPPAPDHLSAPISPSRASASASPSPSASSTTTKAVTVAVPASTPTKTREKERAVSSKKEKRDKEGKPRRKSRRSMSTGDVDQEANLVKPQRHSAQPRLTLGFNDAESMLDAFKDETDRIGSERRYKVKEKKVASKYDGLSHGRAGDLDAGARRAWRQLRRPSDMNEHAAELRRLRSKEASAGKASGTVFVKVLGIESLSVPLPEQDTFFCVTLDNGIDYIRTPYIVLKDGARVNQEFSLVESPNFEFSLSLDIRKDPHIIKALHDKTSAPAPARPTSLLPLSGRETPSSPHRGIRALFGSPRKPRPKSEMVAQNGGFMSGSTNSRAATPLPVAAPPKDTIVKYLIDDKSPTIGKTHIAFAPIAKNCQAKVLEMRYPVFAMFKSGDAAQAGRARGSSHQPAQVIGEETQRPMIGKITLQIFRLPPLPGLSPDDMPQCIDEALRGMRHHAWHEHEYHEGILTQDGGDCSHPKRRLFKLIGGSLVAINEVTKKQVTSIDLRKAVSVIDLNDTKQASQSQRRKRGSDEGLPIRERSFLVEFNDGEGITFSSDKNEDKLLWLETLNGLVGKIPSNPLWAELLAAQKREEESTSTASTSTLAPGGTTKKVIRKVGSSTSLKSKRSASGIPRSASGLRKKEKEKAK